MASTDPFDSAAYKEAQRAEWQIAAPGWRKWYDVLETGGAIVTRTLIELAGIGPGDRVLDVGTGYGEPAVTAAHAVAPTGHVLATDIAADMLNFGRDRAARAGVDNVEFVEADTESLSVAEESFDAILSRQGLQFLPDVAGTLRRFHGFLRRDGRLVAAAWGPPETVQFAHPLPIILDALDLVAPPPGGPGIFALAGREALARLVADAGFRDVETGTVTAVYEVPSAEDCTQWLRDVAPPIVNLLSGRPPEVQDEIWRKVTDAWKPFTTSDGRVRTQNQAVWVAATK